MSEYVEVRAHTYDRRYFATGSAPFSFIWSRNFWKSNGGLSLSTVFPLSLSVSRIPGVLLPLPPETSVALEFSGSTIIVRVGGADCC